MLEFYWAYADYKAMMKLTEKMFQYLLKEIFNKFSLEYQEEKISFKIPWERINFNDLLEKETKIKFKEINREALAEKAKAMGIPIEEGRPKAEIADEIYKKVCRPKIQQPTFIIHHPLGFQPLAKSREKESEELANFQLVIGGVELVNAFSELNDPREQRRRFKEQEKFFKSGLAEAQRLDEDYLEALEYAMPPAAGFGMGLDRLVALLSDSNNLREVILFPTMRPKS
jgi:lysyl-tRNA synthetase class 2